MSLPSRLALIETTRRSVPLDLSQTAVRRPRPLKHKTGISREPTRQHRPQEQDDEGPKRPLRLKLPAIIENRYEFALGPVPARSEQGISCYFRKLVLETRFSRIYTKVTTAAKMPPRVCCRHRRKECALLRSPKWPHRAVIAHFALHQAPRPPQSNSHRHRPCPPRQPRQRAPAWAS